MNATRKTQPHLSFTIGKLNNKYMKKKYWIFKTTYYCPLCGSEKIYRERRYTKKPKSFNKRQDWSEQYDYCNM